MRPFRKNSLWCIVSHGVGSFLCRTCHICNLHTNILETPTKGCLSKGRCLVIVQSLRRKLQLTNVLSLLGHPFAIWVSRCNFTLDCDIVLEFTTLKVNINHLSRSKTSLFNNGTFIQVWNDTRFTHHVDSTIVGDGIPSWSKTISIQRGANTLSITKYQQCRTVPCFQQPTMKLVEIYNFGIILQIRRSLMCRWDKRHESTWSTMARLTHEFKDGIEIGRVTSIEIDHRFEDTGNVLCIAHCHNILGGSVIDQIGARRNSFTRFTRFNPIDITEQRVDFAVMSNDTHGLCQWPSWIGIGRKSPMVNAKFGGIVWILQILIKEWQHMRLYHSLVDNGTTAKRGHVQFIIVPYQSSQLSFDTKTTSHQV
mmetsp:Transcript_30084/g.54410  ORF Transcript_30084/g.54410 Transcript_30084/m.54410 type:complete len:367 (-) Transcript_30084:680-1780(-)